MTIGVNKVIKELNKKLMVNFVGYIKSQNLCISHMNCLHQQLPLPFLLPTPDIIGRTLEFLGANIEHVASWSEIEGQLSSFPHWREDLMGARKFWSSFCTVVIS